jgi:thioredoxin-related protein
MRASLLLRCGVVLAALVLPLTLPAARAADAMPAGIVWKQAAEIDAAFAEARAQNKPLFLYWGAVWCPPCNQVKATVFSRADFIERSRLFVPVYVDGDAPAAQKLGSRFKVSAYPTMLLLRPDGSEITRLPGEVDPARYMQVLQQGINGGRPVKALLASAQGGKPLPVADWQRLAFYSWWTDDQSLLPRAERVGALWSLAGKSQAVAPEASARLALTAAAMAAADKSTTLNKPAALQRVRAVLADPRVSRSAFAEVAMAAGSVPGYLTEAGSAERGALQQQWDRRLTQLAADGQLSRLDRIAATDARVALARLDAPKGPLPLALQTEVRAVTLRAEREVTDRYEREAVVFASSQVLADAGLFDESDAMLRAELKRSATPYYHMLGLASNARKRGDNAAALNWYEQAYATSQGPATRLQWGASYVRALIDLAPTDADRIERAARSVIGELSPTAETFHARNRSALDRMGARLNDWNKDGRQDAALARLRTQLGAICVQLPAQAPERSTCNDALVKKG